MTSRFTLQYVNPLRDLTEARLLSILDEGERGAYATLQWLYRFVEKRNPVARAVKRRLLSALGSLEWDIKMADCPDAQKPLAKAQASDLRAAYDRIENLHAALQHLALAELRGFAHVEKIGTRGLMKGETLTVDPTSIVRLKPVEQWFWCRDGLYAPWTYNDQAMQGRYQGRAVDLGKFVIREIDDAADEIIAKVHVRQETSDADWDGFLEDYGVPPMFVEMPPNVPPEKEREYQAVAEKALSGARGSFPNGAKLHTPSATGSGGAGIFKERLEYLEGQIVLAGTSGKLTILSESGTGTLAGGAQKDAFDEVAEAIASAVSTVMQAQFDLPLLEIAHPGEPVLAYFEFAAVDEDDSGRVLDDAVKAFSAGYAMDASELSEKAGYKLTPISTPTHTQTEMQVVPQPGQTPAASPASPAVNASPVAKPPEGAAPPAALPGKVAAELRVTPEFLAPAAAALDGLLADAADGAISNTELLARAEQLLASLPELAKKMDSTGIAAALARAIETDVAKTLQP